MRLIGSFGNKKNASKFSQFLLQKGINNECEISGNDSEHSYAIWAYNEEYAEEATQWHKEFLANPDDPMFHDLKGNNKFIHAKAIISTTSKNSTHPGRHKKSNSPYGQITIGLLISCIMIFIWGDLITPVNPETVENMPIAKIFSPIKKTFLYDFPEAFEILEKIAIIYPGDKLQNPDALPPEGKYLFESFVTTPHWLGFYDLVLAKIHNTKKLKQYKNTLFEKIRQGELWRLFTPCLLHGDIFHLLFNMIWLMILGNQIESRINPGKFLIAIITIGVVSNTSQYLMGGPIFLGLSGVIIGMLTFIWSRQRYAPWEGYSMQRSTILFIGFFVFVMFSLQTFFFFGEVFGYAPFSSSIANTAHISGAIAGALLGRMNFFALDY